MGKIISEIKSGDSTLKVGIQDFKKKLIEYFKKNVHATLSDLMKIFELNLEDLDYLQFCVDELVKEKYLNKIGLGVARYIYYAGEKLNYAGMED